MSDHVRLGGLMRCCTETLSERTTPGTDGEIQPCKYCTQSTIFRDGAWEWNRPSSVKWGTR